MSKTKILFAILLLSSLSGCERILAQSAVPEPTSLSSLATPYPEFQASNSIIGETPTPDTADHDEEPSLPMCLMIESYIEYAEVLRVTDGDTIVVEIEGREYRLRYIGIDTPEIHPQMEYLGRQAAERNRELVAGKTLILYRDQSNVDDYGRLLRYVVADGVFVNQVLVREGLADAKDYHPDTACSLELKEAENQARRENLGIWQQP